MAAVNKLPVNEQFSGSDWKEFVKSYSPGSVTSSLDEGEAILTGLIPFSKQRGAERYCVGWQLPSPIDAPDALNDVFVLTRTPPVQHPTRDGWYAVSCDIQPYVPSNLGRLKVPVVDPTRLPAYARYDKAVLTIRFRPIDYYIAPDQQYDPTGVANQGVPEWQRWTRVDLNECSVEALSGQGFNLIYKEGPFSSPTKNPATQFPAPLNNPVVKTRMSINWFSVPERHIIDQNGVPSKLLAASGKLNSTYIQFNPFSPVLDGQSIGFPTGTLFCSLIGLKKRKWAQWCNGDRAGDRFLYDVVIGCDYFDPPNGAGPAYGGNSTIRGHNLFPAPVVPSAGNFTTFLPWYYCTRPTQADINAASSVPFLDSYNYKLMFESVLNVDP